MSEEERSEDLLAIYRAGAADEPDARLDAAILRAARRRDGRAHATRVAMLVAACATLAVALNTLSPPQRLATHSATAPRPGLEDGRARLFLLTLKSDTQRPGMAQRPAMLAD